MFRSNDAPPQGGHEQGGAPARNQERDGPDRALAGVAMEASKGPNPMRVAVIAGHKTLQML